MDPPIYEDIILSICPVWSNLPMNSIPQSFVNRLSNAHVPSPNWPEPALLETAVRFRTSPLAASAPIKVSEA
jgi:hypothetical protein